MHHDPAAADDEHDQDHDLIEDQEHEQLHGRSSCITNDPGDSTPLALRSSTGQSTRVTGYPAGSLRSTTASPTRV